MRTFYYDVFSPIPYKRDAATTALKGGVLRGRWW